jgi:uncharacterized integral membrane protein
VPDLSHLWQRFMLTSALVVGVLVGAAATIFGYSNLTTVNVNFSAVRLEGVPLWTVAVVPLIFVLVAGTLYHWADSLHHFTEHMRHRRRVHELEAELKTLRAHLDQVLDMPTDSVRSDNAEPLPAVAEPSTQALPEASPKASRAKRVTLTMASEPSEPAAVTTNGGHETPAAEPKPEA